MSKMRNRVMRMGGTSLLAGALVLSLSACGGAQKGQGSDTSTAIVVSDAVIEEAPSEASASSAAGTETSITSLGSMSTSGVIATSDLFTERDLTQTADLSGATSLTLTSGQDTQITAEGVYVISGEATDATIVVDVDSAEKVQLVLDGVTITNADAPAIYVKSADKVFVTTAEGSTNKLTVSGTFAADGDINTDAVIYSRDDLVLNGLGTLEVSSTANGISSKDDLKVTGGSLVVSSQEDALEANESILMADGTITINASKDGLHAEYDEDDATGMVYICGGTLEITAAGDGIQATTYLQVDGGTLSVNAGEALEATYVQVNGGSIDVNASDDGINASYKSSSIGTPTLEVTGGKLAVTMASGDTDALDTNGNLVISGGEITISAQSAFDFDGTVSFTGGTVTVNGEQLSEITNSMMGGMGGGPMGGQMPGGEMGGGMGHGGPRGGSDSQTTQMVDGGTYQG